jgi:transposase-like protein
LLIALNYYTKAMKYEFATKPDNCPLCGSQDIIKILYGLPIFTPELEAKIKEGNVILGGCILSSKKPTWRCKDCKTDIYKTHETSTK